VSIRTQFAFVFAVLVMLSAVATQAQDKVRRIGLLAIHEGQCGNLPLREGLRELGYVEGKNIAIECRHAGGQIAGLETAAADLVRTRPELIVTMFHVGAEALQKTTRDIPVVMIASGDPVAAGLVASMARPERNFTGVTYFASELYAKRLEFLKALVPNLKRVGLLVQTTGLPKMTQSYLDASEYAARELGIELVVLKADNAAEIKAAFEKMVTTKIQAAHVLGYALFSEEAPLIASLSSLNEIPTIHFLHSFPSMGGLMGYGPDYLSLQRRTAAYVDKILRGAKPGELPIEQPTQLVLAINAGAARDLGLRIPQALLLRADKVIE
jgi:putative tryptophan/tyrosine transport system substrate-binding protein